MLERIGRSRLRVIAARNVAAIVLASLSLATVPASAQEQAPQDPRWNPWLGCWELVIDATDYESVKVDKEKLVCLTSRPDGAGVNLTTLANGEVALEETMISDGVRRPVNESGCEGSQLARWSGDAHRIYVDSELVCQGGARRIFSGISFLTPRSIWVDIQLTASGEHRELVVRRYRMLGVKAAAIALDFAGLPAMSTHHTLAAATARAALGAPMSVDDVIEAASLVDLEAVEAMLLESTAQFEINAATLLRLADANLDDGIIDLMVALSFPDVFVVESGDVQSQDEGYQRSPGYFPRGYGYFPRGYGYSIGWNPYYYSPFGYGYYGYGLPYTRSVTNITFNNYGGSVINGRGYTRIQVRNNAGRSGNIFSRLLSNRGSDRSSGTVGSGGYSGGKNAGSSSGGSKRKAKPRGGSS